MSLVYYKIYVFDYLAHITIFIILAGTGYLYQVRLSLT